jgi:hypothetical protein
MKPIHSYSATNTPPKGYYTIPFDMNITYYVCAFKVRVKLKVLKGMLLQKHIPHLMFERFSSLIKELEFFFLGILFAFKG